MPRVRAAGSPRVVCRTARAGLRLTRGQRRRLTGLLVAAGDMWCCVLELNAWRRARQDRPLASYTELCRELAAAGPGTFGELDRVAAPHHGRALGSPGRHRPAPGLPHPGRPESRSPNGEDPVSTRRTYGEVH